MINKLVIAATLYFRRQAGDRRLDDRGRTGRVQHAGVARQYAGAAALPSSGRISIRPACR